MRVSINGLIVTGPGKPDATLVINGSSHLVFGPTDTGKSYIEECIAYCLGSDERPRNVGYSEGYTRASLQVKGPDGSLFTIFRDLTEGREAIYEGAHSLPPQSWQSPVTEDVGSTLVLWGLAAEKKVLVKSGVLGNVTAGDLRRLSLFDEIKTLDKVSLEGKDNLFKMRNRAVVALAMTGVDDSGAVLAVTTDQRNIAKGHVEAIEEELQGLYAEIPSGWTKDDCSEGLEKVRREIRELGDYFRANTQELDSLKSKYEGFDAAARDIQTGIVGLVEAKSRFQLLDDKYQSDVSRLSSLISASDVVESFDPRPCPLCKTDLAHRIQHSDGNQDDSLKVAATAEITKIELLRLGLKTALSDIDDELVELREKEVSLQLDIKDNLAKQSALLRPATPNEEPDYLGLLSERRAELAMASRNFERIDELNGRLGAMKVRTKRRKQSVDRDLSSSSSELCARVLSLLTGWGVPVVDSVYFDQARADIHINNRERISFGKGKRGIFLTALVVALMERALEEGNPHLGVIVIDSPVVTYKDPKHGSPNPDEALDPSVKDKFYSWLASRKEPGQVIVLENEEPEEYLKKRLSYTEFVGVGEAEGRKGFFPI